MRGSTGAPRGTRASSRRDRLSLPTFVRYPVTVTGNRTKGGGTKGRHRKRSSRGARMSSRTEPSRNQSASRPRTIAAGMPAAFPITSSAAPATSSASATSVTCSSRPRESSSPRRSTTAARPETPIATSVRPWRHARQRGESPVHVREVDPRVGAYEPMPRLADDEVPAAPDDPYRLLFHECRPRREVVVVERHEPAFGLRDHLLGHDDAVALGERRVLRVRGAPDELTGPVARR